MCTEKNIPVLMYNVLAAASAFFSLSDKSGTDAFHLHFICHMEEEDQILCRLKKIYFYFTANYLKLWLPRFYYEKYSDNVKFITGYFLVNIIFVVKKLKNKCFCR